MTEQEPPATVAPCTSPEIEHLISRCEARELPCPWCGVPLLARPFELDGQAELLLFCQDQTCGFEEF